MKIDTKYYMVVRYPIEVIKIPKDEGGGYMACIPALGNKAVRADGPTVNKALKNLRDIMINYVSKTPHCRPNTIKQNKKT